MELVNEGFLRVIKRIILHCSDSPHFSKEGRMLDVEDVRSWHKAKGWKDVGYHFVIPFSGEIQTGRPLGIEGAHAKGNNKDTIGICAMGKNTFTVSQIVSLKGLLQMLMTTYSLRLKDIYGHYQVDHHGKTCPNYLIEKFRELM